MKLSMRLAASAAALSVGLATFGLSTAAAADDASPTASARAAGINQPGDAHMGWSLVNDPKADQPAKGNAAKSTAVASPSLVAATTPGIDVSHWQGSVNWTTYYNQGNRFAYIKSTEGTSYTDPNWGTNYTGSYNAGFIRGTYHFARPDISTGATQANFFVNNGGGWSADGKTLPGALDIEYNPYGATCYGLSQASMRSWIDSFVNQYHARTTRWPVIYSTFDWWNTCTGNASNWSTKSPFWIARYNSTVGTLPAGYSYYTFWQWTSSPIDQDKFNGSMTGLTNLAKNT